MKTTTLRLLAGFILALALTGPCFATADNVSDPVSDKWRQKHSGSSNTAIAVDVNGQLNMPSGLDTKHEKFNLTASSAIAVAQILIPTTTLINGSTTFPLSALTQPTDPKILSFTIGQSSFPDVVVVITTVSVTGTTARGEVITRTYVVSSTATSYSDDAFISLSSVTLGRAAAVVYSTGAALNVALKIGNAGAIGTAGNMCVASDNYKVVMGGLNISTATANVTQDTIVIPGYATLGASTVDFWYSDCTSAPIKPR